jgi:signal transduction histidine kinase
LSGTGLGLSVVQRIVTAFGGAILVESEPNRGSRFTIRLPLAAQPHMATPDDVLDRPSPALS